MTFVIAALVGIVGFLAPLRNIGNGARARGGIGGRVGMWSR